MIRVMDLRIGTGGIVGLFFTGVLLGTALVVGSAQAANKPPVLPPARVNWQKPKEMMITGTAQEVERRVNLFLTRGWGVKPGCMSLTGDEDFAAGAGNYQRNNVAMVILEKSQ